MAPYQFIGIQVRRIAGQEVEGQSPLGSGNVLLHQGCLVRWQAIEHQLNRLLAMAHHLLQQFDEQFGVERALIEAEPERPPGIDSRGRTDRLPLSGTLDDRRVAAHAPGLAMYRVGTKSRFVPEEHLGALRLLA